MEPTASSASDAHPLPERWSFWFDRFSSDATFEASIQELTSFASVEGFWRTYCHLARPTALGNGDNYHVFRGDRPPAWEAMPNCGTWLHRLDRASPELDALWERLLLAMVGEALGEPNPLKVDIPTASISVVDYPEGFTSYEDLAAGKCEAPTVVAVGVKPVVEE